MINIVYVGTDKWFSQLNKLLERKDFLICHAVIPPNSGSLKDICLENNIPFSAVQNVNSIKNELMKINFDLYIVIGHPFLLRKELLDIAEGIGFHPSLLPKRRGRAPLNWAIIDGLKESGVTLFKLAEGADNGIIYFQERFKIDDNDTVEELVGKVNIILESNLSNLISKFPNLGGYKQNEKEATYTARRYPKDSEINLEGTVDQAERLVRALKGPYPSAFIRFSNGEKLYINKCSKQDEY